MDPRNPSPSGARQMADAVRPRARAKGQRHQAGLLNQAQAETLWVGRERR